MYVCQFVLSFESHREYFVRCVLTLFSDDVFAWHWRRIVYFSVCRALLLLTGLLFLRNLVPPGFMSLVHAWTLDFEVYR